MEDAVDVAREAADFGSNRDSIIEAGVIDRRTSIYPTATSLLKRARTG
jgi:hypothetical protein